MILLTLLQLTSIINIMEYEFSYNPITGLASARFSMEHELMGPWLEVEIGNSVDKVDALINDIKSKYKVKNGVHNDIFEVGCEYTLILSHDSVNVIANTEFEFGSNEGVDLEYGLYDDLERSIECGIEDFEEMLMQWKMFIKTRL